MYKQQFNCTTWQFENIPEFKDGKMRPLFADCGSGLNKCLDSRTKDNSFMHAFDGVDAKNIKAYADNLEGEGFKKIFENEVSGNLFYQFSVSDGLLYISLMKNTAVARFILDRCEGSDISSFGYDKYESVCDNTKFVQFSLHYGKMIKSISSDCGMNYIYRLRDNSVIIIDGGEMEQATDLAVNDYMDFLRSITNTPENEKIRISLWICTHAHNDHCDFMSKILRFHSDEITLDRVAFNFPNPENVRQSPSVVALKQRILLHFPNADYIKPHAGCKFNIANAEIQVLSSSEDATGVDEEDLFPGTNSTSMVFTITADGIRTLFLTDCWDDNGSVVIDNYNNDVIDCEFLQAAHHGINSVYDVYEKINAKYILLPQCKMNMDTRFSGVYAHLCSRYGEENIKFASDYTDIFTLCNGSYSSETREHIGTDYDRSDW